MADLGYEPLKGRLILTDGADWVVTLTTGDVWPAGTTVWAKVGDLPQWDATVDASTGTASFKVQSDITDTVPDKTPYFIYLRYPGTPSTEFAWFQDKVARTK
ncbi:hypothetical protein L3Y19_gp031 [Gordonia phage Neville]|uniref:LtfC/p132/Gp6 beta-sandwich domain-containing protein n=2 Tax=Nevillevirus TaxID=3044773 RepID=A0A515MGW7_9CAUD|nr:hypothetical protein L3Y19_gp031 [Gordonia phage Neville]YP_010246016.1 hypothetical protein L3Y20_gp031 [Gordonia phage Trax]AXQ64403.1 hypothetical protein SEA_NEVILLE_31 [Gordonia phage Neville]QDM55918.1 hypothetical protein SEA_TRAX_31 [Gordonia phage Trax]